jgi:2-methylcitrate dehydratase PrpD
MQFSTSYSLALTMLKGRNTPGVYTMEALADPQIRAFASRVSVRGDVELTRLFEGRQPARVRVRSRSGGTFEELVAHAKGSPGAPLTSDEIDEKFRTQASDVFGAQRSADLLRVLRHIDEFGDMAELSKLLGEGLVFEP